MTDAVETDSPEAPEPESPSTQAEGNEETLETAAKASDGSTAEEKLEDDKEKAPEKPSPRVLSERLAKLIDSKGGDQDKFVESIHESWGSLSKLAKEFQELKESLTKQPEKPEADLEENDDYKELQSELTALDEELQANEKSRSNITTEFNKNNSTIERLLGALEVSPQERKGEFEKRIETLKARQETLRRYWQETFKDDKRITREKKELSKKQSEVKQRISESKAQAQKQWQEDLEEQARFREEFDNSVLAAAKEHNIPEARHEKLAKKVNDMAFAWLARQSILGNANAVLPKNFVSEVVKDYAEEFGYSKVNDFKEMSKAKAETTGKQIPPKTPVPPPDKPQAQNKKPKTADEARAEIRKAFQQLSQRMSQQK